MNDAQEASSPARFFFAKDQDTHWYMIPESLRKRWEGYTQNDLKEWADCEEFETLFGQYRINGGISHISFCSPEGHS